MGVGVDGVEEGEPVPGGEAAIALDGADFGIDHGADMRFRAAEDVGPATADFDGFEDHSCLTMGAFQGSRRKVADQLSRRPSR